MRLEPHFGSIQHSDQSIMCSDIEVSVLRRNTRRLHQPFVQGEWVSITHCFPQFHNREELVFPTRAITRVKHQQQFSEFPVLEFGHSSGIYLQPISVRCLSVFRHIFDKCVKPVDIDETVLQLSFRYLSFFTWAGVSKHISGATHFCHFCYRQVCETKK